MSSSSTFSKIVEENAEKAHEKNTMVQRKNISPLKQYNNSFKNQKVKRRKRPAFKKVEKIKDDD